MASGDRSGPAVCPYVHQVQNDFVCLYPQTLFCTSDDDGRPRFPSAETAQHFCLDHFDRCEGYRERQAREP